MADNGEFYTFLDWGEGGRVICAVLFSLTNNIQSLVALGQVFFGRGNLNKFL